MAPPPHAGPGHLPRVRPSDRGTPPPDVTDPLLWALAVDVAAAHRPGPDGACTNLQCRGQRGACGPLRTAQWAAHHARHATGRPPHAEPQPWGPHAPTAQPVEILSPRTSAERGRAAVPTTARRFTGWFATTAEPAPHRPIPFRRPPVAALVA